MQNISYQREDIFSLVLITDITWYINGLTDSEIFCAAGVIIENALAFTQGR